MENHPVRAYWDSAIPGMLQVKLRLGELSYITQVTVVELNGVHDLVLGRTLFKELKAVLDFGESTCTFKKGTKQVTLKAHVPKSQPKSKVLSAAQFKRASKGLQAYLCIVKSSGELSADEQLDSDTAKEVPQGPMEPWVSTLLEEYESIFSTGVFPDKPAARSVPHAIPLLPNSQPTFRPMLRLSPKELQVLKEYVAELVEKGLIRPSTSPYGASAIFVPKPDGTLRVCIDYRAINKITVKNKYPLPRIDDLLDKLTGAKYFSSLDLQTGFHQVPIQERDIEKTAFRTPFGHYEWTVLPLGLCNSAPTFQMVMNNTFKDYVDKFVLVYMDDILIFSKSEEEHKVHLKLVLERLRECNFKLRLKKCSFSHTQLKYVGHIVSEEGIKADPAKTSTVEDWPVPSSVADVRQFTGFANYFRKYIKAYSAMASPLTNLTRKSTAFVWGKEQQDAFQAVKYALTHSPVLVMPDFTKPFEVWCDASKLGLGALLLQEGRPVAYESRKLKPAEVNYGVGEQELLAVVHALKTWRCYVEGVPFTVVTDHNPNTFIGQSGLSGRQARWQEFLSRFNMEWKHIPGRVNVADPLSRHPDFVKHMSILSSSMCSLESPVDQHFTEVQAKVKAAYERDPYFQEPPSDLELREGLWYKDDMLVIPDDPKLKKDILKEVHDAPYSGHGGVKKTLDHVRRFFWWPHLVTDVETYVKQCDLCQRDKSRSTKKPGLLQPLPVPEGAWEEVTMT
jgi:hypothetical protein